MKKYLALLLVLFSIIKSNAQPGTLNTAFGNGGKISRNISSGATWGSTRASTIQADGKILVTVNAGYCATVLRLKSTGTADSSFGINGYGAYISAGRFNAIALQADGKIVVAGGYFSNTINSQTLTARYNTDGTLDNTFSNTGIIITGVSAANNYANAAAIQADGKIVVAGSEPNGNATQMVIYRFNSNGTADNTFNLTGKQAFGFGNGSTSVAALAIQTDGKIIGVGSSGLNTQFTIVRLFTNGNLDDGFDTDGKVFTSIGTLSNIATSVALQSDGKIIVGGYSSSGFYVNATLCRYNTNGSPDNSFDGDGKLTTAISTQSNAFNSIKIQDDGKIVGAGYANLPSGAKLFAVVRYNSTGTPDAAFGSIGIVTFTPNDGINPQISSLNLKGDGTLVVAGFSDLSYVNYFHVAALTSTGLFSTTFNGNGKALFDFSAASDDYPSGMALTPGGKIFMAGDHIYSGVTFSSFKYRIGGAQFNNDGTFDNNFNANSTLDFSIAPTLNVNTRACAVQPDGKQLTAGFYPTVYGVNFYVKRLQDNGLNTDASFGANNKGYAEAPFFYGAGYSYAYAYCIAIQPDGKILVAGDVWNGAFYVMGIARFKSNGILDSSFNGTGLQRIAVANYSNAARSIAIQSDGKIVIGGFAKPNNSTTYFALARLNGDGTTDNSFNGTGSKLISTGTALSDYAYSVAIQADGKIVVCGDSYDGTHYTMGIVRCNSNGDLDNTFNGTGKRILKLNSLTTYCKSVVIQNDNKIVLGGLSTNAGNRLQFALARLLVNGSLDNSFGTSGVAELDIYPGKSMNYSAMVLAPNKIYISGYTTLQQLNDYILISVNNDAGPLAAIAGSDHGICPGSNTSFESDVSGTTYQWQVDNGGGFVNLGNIAPYSGTNTVKLTITAATSNLYGFKYKCIVNNNTTSATYTLKFANSWTGAAGNAWETAANWSCGIVPDGNSDVYITSGKPNNPILNSARSVRSINQSVGAVLTIGLNQQLTITGK